MKNFVAQLKKLKDSGYIVKSEITGKPFFGEVTIIITDGQIDRINNFDTGEIIRTKESIKI
jgi:hypothetical protein